MSDEDQIEQIARRIAAAKIGSADPTGARLPDDIWRQAITEAKEDFDRIRAWSCTQMGALMERQ